MQLSSKEINLRWVEIIRPPSHSFTLDRHVGGGTMARDAVETRFRILEKEIRNLKATQELLYEIITTHTILQAKAAFEGHENRESGA